MEIIKTKNGERYKEKMRLSNGKVQTKTFRRKTDAISWKRKVETEKAQGILGISKAKAVPFDMVELNWFDTKVKNIVATKTLINYRSNLDSKVIPHFGNQDIAKVGLREIDALKNQCLEKKLNPKTINKVMTMIRQILLFAVDCGYIKTLPFSRSILMKTYDRQYEFFDEHEVKQLLLKNQSEAIYPIIFLMIHTGMRPGEIMGLCWDRVNTIANRIEITRTLSARGKLQEHTKGGRARYFPMNALLKMFFESLKKKQQDPKFVFVDAKGKPYSPDHFRQRHFRDATIRAGVRELRFYDIRHTFASHFMMKGGNLFELQKLLGHANIDETLIYAHLSPDHLEKASQIVNFGIKFEQDKAAGPYLALAK